MDFRGRVLFPSWQQAWEKSFIELSSQDSGGLNFISKKQALSLFCDLTYKHASVLVLCWRDVVYPLKVWTACSFTCELSLQGLYGCVPVYLALYSRPSSNMSL